MLDRQQTIDKLVKLRESIRDDLADESMDRQASLETVERDLTMLIGDLIPTNGDVAGIELLLELALPASAGTCAKCGGCPAGKACIGTLLLEDHKPCNCVAASV